MKHRIVLSFVLFLLFGILLAAGNATAQSIAYRQTNLAAFLSDQPFFITENKAGHVTALDGTGLGVVPGSFIVPNAGGNGFEDLETGTLYFTSQFRAKTSRSCRR